MEYKSVMNREFAISDKNPSGGLWNKSVNHMGIWDKVFIKASDSATLASVNETLSARALHLKPMMSKKDKDVQVSCMLSASKGATKEEYNVFSIDVA
tara:strand:- start:234 stop:524 length:291 start_codon:yes stop_codon:yes gene_type:complete